MCFRDILTPENRTKRSVEVPQSSTGSDLAAKVCQTLGLTEGTSLKLICGGRVVADDGPLLDQGVRPGAAVMVLRMDKNDERLKVTSELRFRLSFSLSVFGEKSEFLSS